MRARCVFCGGKLAKRRVTFAYGEAEKHLLIENVPAEVCEQCGEKTYSPDVTDKILEYANNDVKPSRTIKVPVYRFAS